MTIISLIALYILNLIDYFETRYIIAIFGLGAEINPIVRFLFKNNCAWIVKIIVVPILLICMWRIIKRDKEMIWAAYFMIAFYSIVVVWNFITMKYSGIL